MHYDYHYVDVLRTTCHHHHDYNIAYLVVAAAVVDAADDRYPPQCDAAGPM